MSFGRKGLAATQAAPVPGGGFGKAVQATGEGLGQTTQQSAPAPSAGGDAVSQSAEQDDVAAKRAAFIASERARSGGNGVGAVSAPSENPDPLINLRNMSEPARPAQPVQSLPVGESGIPMNQEEEIRAMARGMARGTALPGPSGVSSRQGSASRKGSGGFIFGDPQGRSVGIAYVLWFVLGQFSLHRFYCGEKDTAIMQIALWIGSLVILFIFPPIGLVGFLLWVCWLIGDLFMIPGMLKKFKAQHDYSTVFT